MANDYEQKTTDVVLINAQSRVIIIVMGNNTEGRILTVNDLLGKPLSIPSYQRPYKWGITHVNQLIDDILLFKDKSAYRLGTVVLHPSDGILEIVDGQQRIITLTLILLALKLEDQGQLCLCQLEFKNPISKVNIKNNYIEIEKRIGDFDEQSKKFLLDKCEVAMFVLSDLSECFQFFDSQNARGKDLVPHDLLKAYHLREMKNASSEHKVKIVEEWEKASSQGNLEDLLGNYLYRIKQWIKGYSAGYFTKNDINVFKGINLEDNYKYPFKKLPSIALEFIERHNKKFEKIRYKNIAYPFQISQTIINGEYFFKNVSYYNNLLDTYIEGISWYEKEKLDANAKNILEKINTYAGKHRTGDRYVRNLFDCALLFYIDKFGFFDISKVIEKIFLWAYSLRLQYHAVYRVSMDKYARGINDRVQNKSIFRCIDDAVSHHEVYKMHVNKVESISSTKTEDIEKLFKSLCGETEDVSE